jgi:hypothetical protein
VGEGAAWDGGRPWAGCGADAEVGRRAGARDVASRRRPGQTALLVTSLKMIFSKILYISAPNFEYESCRSSFPIPLSKRLYRVFSIDFVGEVCQL